MPKLYVSDLDGTLLRSDATLSEFSRTQLARLLADGLAFTVASARSVVSMQMLLDGLTLRLPVIELNGAILSDLATGRHEVVHAIQGGLLRELYAFIRERGHVPFISSVDGRRDYLDYSQLTHEGMRWYVDDREAAGDKRLRMVDDLAACLDQEVVALTLIEGRAVIEELEGAVAERFPGALATNAFENKYSPGWFWLTIHDPRATKGQALVDLLERLGLERADVVVFGDDWNDLSMFEQAGRAVAVANADERVKARADLIVGANDADGVVKYLLDQAE